MNAPIRDGLRGPEIGSLGDSEPPVPARRIAWTRLAALAIAACLLLNAALWTLSRAWLGGAVAVVEALAAILLVRERTRAFGVAVGAAASAMTALASMFGDDMAGLIVPLCLLGALIALARRLDRARSAAETGASPPVSES